MHRATISSCTQMYDVSHAMQQSCHNVILTAFAHPRTGQKLPKMPHMCLNHSLPAFHCEMFTVRACNTSGREKEATCRSMLKTAKDLISLQGSNSLFNRLAFEALRASKAVKAVHYKKIMSSQTWHVDWHISSIGVSHQCIWCTDLIIVAAFGDSQLNLSEYATRLLIHNIITLWVIKVANRQLTSDAREGAWEDQGQTGVGQSHTGCIQQYLGCLYLHENFALCVATSCILTTLNPIDPAQHGFVTWKLFKYICTKLIQAARVPNHWKLLCNRIITHQVWSSLSTADFVSSFHCVPAAGC